MRQKRIEWWQDGPLYHAIVPGLVFRTEVILRKRGMVRGVGTLNFHKNRDVSPAQDSTAYECTLFWCDGDYLVIQPRMGESSRMEVYHGTSEGLTHIGGGTGGLYDLALAHKDPEAWQRELGYRERERWNRVYGLRRTELDTVVGRLQPKSYFLSPDGKPGFVNAIGKKYVTWKYLEALPAGVEAVQLADPPEWSDASEYQRQWRARKLEREAVATA
ncbi:MAG: hypothetical protein K2Z25_19295 [Beijerinckiaceae bacterium]|nr:hypothetical protein [Beijerinckiaceae bacterium]